MRKAYILGGVDYTVIFMKEICLDSSENGEVEKVLKLRIGVLKSQELYLYFFVKQEEQNILNEKSGWPDFCSTCFAKGTVKARESTLWPSNSTSGYLSEESQNTNLQRSMHPSVHYSTIYNSQVIEATCLSAHQ